MSIFVVDEVGVYTGVSIHQYPPQTVEVLTGSTGPCLTYSPIKSPSSLNKLSLVLNEPFTSLRYISISAPTNLVYSTVPVATGVCKTSPISTAVVLLLTIKLRQFSFVLYVLDLKMYL